MRALKFAGAAIAAVIVIIALVAAVAVSYTHLTLPTNREV